MRPALLLVALLLAGCATTSGPTTPTGAAPALGSWKLDCGHSNATWVQDCAMRASSTPGPKQEIWLAVSPKDPANVVLAAKDLNPESSAKCVWNGVFVTKDSGKTWHDIVIGGKYADRQPTSPYFGYACNTDPMFQFGVDGALHYGVEMYDLGGKDAFWQYNGTPLQPFTELATPGWKVVLATSRDGGLTWPDVVTFGPDAVLRDDFSRMTVSPKSKTVLEMIQFDQQGEGTTCNVMTTRDSGKTADPPVHWKYATDPGAICVAVAASPKGGFVLAFDGAGGYEFARSSDDGKTWTDQAGGFAYKPIPQFTESKYRTGSNVELAYAADGTLYAIYAAKGADEADVLFRSSKDDGRTWTEPVQVNDDAPSAHQWMPNLAVAGDGSVHAFYMDKRYDPEHKLIDITHAVSADGGKTWANERVTTKSFDGDLGRHQRGFPFIGDYLGVAAVGDDVWAGFPESTNGVETVVAAAHVHRTP